MGQTGKSRSHSFTGCWTCRRRRVKCDAGVPSCKRCKTAGLDCEGYGFRFDIPEGVQSSRQSLPADSRPDLILRLSNDEIDECLADIDVASGTLHKGPFSLIVFSDDETVAQEVHKRVSTRLPSRSRSISSAETITTARTSKQLDSEVIFSPPSRIPASTSTLVSPNKGSHSEILARTQVYSRPASLPMELSLLNLHPHEQRLFHHYIHFVKDQLSPLAGFVCSAYAAIVPSIAISGQTSNASFDAGAAVFHGVCGVAATSLSANAPLSSEYRLEALHHEQLALRHLRRSIESGTDAYLTLAVAIMMLLLFEHLSGRAQEYRSHIQAGLRCLVLSEQGNPDNSTTSVISEQFLLACALGNIVPNIRVGSLRGKLKDGRVGYFEEQAGMALGMLDVIISINECYSFSLQQNGMGVAVEVIEDLGHQLALHDPGEEVVDSFNGRTGALAYYAASLYFARAVRGVEAAHPEAIWAVEKGLQQLEAMKPTGRELNNCVIAWASCLLGSECALPAHRDRFMRWCGSPEARDMLNLAAINMVAQHSWKMQAEAPETYCLLWYQFAEGIDGVWYPERTEVQYSPAGPEAVGRVEKEPSLAETLRRSEGLSKGVGLR